MVLRQKAFKCVSYCLLTVNNVLLNTPPSCLLKRQQDRIVKVIVLVIWIWLDINLSSFYSSIFKVEAMMWERRE